MAEDVDLTGREKTSARPTDALLQRFVRPYGFITGYYVLLVALGAAIYAAYPDIVRYAPIGGAADFAVQARDLAFEPVDLSLGPAELPVAAAVRLVLALASSFLLMLPVVWICMGTRRRRDISQSLVHTILVLPIVITGIVHVVHDSLALAFSLAGIVAGVRFRHTLKDSADTTYLFTAIGVGVACGINAVEVAAIISIFFNYIVLGLWLTEFGERATGQAMFAHRWMARRERGPDKRKGDKKRKHDRDGEDADVLDDDDDGDEDEDEDDGSAAPQEPRREG